MHGYPLCLFKRSILFRLLVTKQIMFITDGITLEGDNIHIIT